LLIIEDAPFIEYAPFLASMLPDGGLASMLPNGGSFAEPSGS
jgi:hypothetical protein